MPPKRKSDQDEDYKQKKRNVGGKNETVSVKVQNSLEEEKTVYQDFSKELILKADHEQRPIWIYKDKLIFLEAFSPLYQQAYDFLVAIAEPESRPEFIHTYRLTENSLNAAVAISIDAESIIKVLNRLCKTNVPQEVIKFIKETTYTFGKAKIVLKNNCYFIESKYPEILRELLKNPVIYNSREINEEGQNQITGSSSSTAAPFLESAAPIEDSRNLDYTRIGMEMMDRDDEEDFLEENNDNEEADLLASDGTALSMKRNLNRFKTVSFMIKQGTARTVKKTAKLDSNYPLMEEYDFKNDHRNPNLVIDLRPSTKIRPYQEKSLSKMFGNGRARSGIIVLPCGAGKSLTGVTAASTVKKSTIVMCINNASVKQWKEQFLLWTNIEESAVKLFTSVKKDTLPLEKEPCVIITTYSMICHSGKRSTSGELLIKLISSREWGLMILDEVHVAPADMFQKVVDMINAHCKLGLTATLVREDNKIQDLPTLVGPKLYEANWIDLTAQGYLAKVLCAEVWCPMTKEFYAEYIKNSVGARSRLQRLLYTLNPTKFRMCEFLVKYHSEKGHKIIIFSDDVPALWLYCEAMKAIQPIPYIFGDTSEATRLEILTAFKTRSELTCIGLSKVGDTALDIPEANVIIQVSSHFGARRQEAQRLGRILRPKANPSGGYNAFFYTLISTDTKEMYFSSKRQQYLIDQGYTFKVVQDLYERANKESKILKNVSQELDLLNRVLSMDYEQYDTIEEKALQKYQQGEIDEEQAPVDVKRKTTTMSSISGMENVSYSEYKAKN
jgi:DNA excision repair protein ERCC-3